MDAQQVSLQTIGSGSAIAKFDTEIQKVLENIVDPNTPAETVRTITLQVKIKPDQSREVASIEIGCTSKLADNTPYPSRIFIGKTKAGEIIGCESDPRQMSMNFDETVQTAADITTGGK